MSSSTKVGRNAVFHALDMIAGTLQIIYGFILYQESFEGFIIPIYIVFFGLVVIFMVFYIPNWLALSIPFYHHVLGRGLTFLFNALLVIDPWGFGLFAGGYIAIVGVLYVSLWITNRYKCTEIVLPPPFFFSSGDNPRYQFTRQLTKSILQSPAHSNREQPQPQEIAYRREPDHDDEEDTDIFS